MSLVTASDVQARLGVPAYNRLFARSGGGTPDLTFLSLCVAEAESQVRIWTKAAFPDGFDATGGTVDIAIVGAAVDVVCYIAARRHTSAMESGAYRQGFDDARTFFKALSRDQDARPVTAITGRAKPRAGISNVVDATGVPTNAFTRAASAQDFTGF